KIRLRGKGGKGEAGGPNGDLLLLVHVAAHKMFGRKGDNLTITVPVAFDEAALGAEIQVPTLNGQPVKIRIPAGTPNGRTFRARGKGAPHKSTGVGDLLVTVEVRVPDELSDEERTAIEAYRAARANLSPRDELFDQVKS
ncbi:MAG: DnaJ C-terminal domain-containing protein, partial [Aeromicrobium sp.]